MPKTPTLIAAFIIGVALMIAFAFTLVGLAGEVLAAMVLFGVALRGACAGVARVLRIGRC
jgi:hypothetical protein